MSQAESTAWEWLPDGSVTSPSGYRAGAAACGLKAPGELDLMLLLSEPASRVGAVFTRNQVVAAPVIVDRETIAAGGDSIRAVVANAGVANACTGEQGLSAARATQAAAAARLGCDPGQVLLLSTGVIGVPLPLEKVRAGIDQAWDHVDPAGGAAAASAIMTTDTVPKHRALRLELSDGPVVLGGIAKGAGMIHPDMATMLAVVTTDVTLPRHQLQAALQRAVDITFNCITVDGDTSTNDSVLLLANGTSGVELNDADVAAFEAALLELCRWLAQAIVRDAEGATKFVTLVLNGAETDEQARLIARTVATSPLVKTALHGGDPNWGRVLAAAGRAGPALDPDRISLWIGRAGEAQIQLVRAGAALDYSEEAAGGVFASAEFTLRLDLGLGGGSATVWTCDLSHEYVTINSHYRT